ncbi:MAG: hypothetical protein IT319_08785 [Anaerolineae bacterium]|nr:hypothetical protein [Anaerolineae bacterium]
MLIRFFIAAALFLTACQPFAGAETTVATIETTEVADTPAIPVTQEFPTAAQAPDWVETEMNGVQLGMWKPAGWEIDQSQGLVLAERNPSPQGLVAGGMLIYCFVPLVDEWGITSEDNANFALAVLTKVVQMPSHTGNDVTVSDPVGFMWGEHQAAYYLLATGTGMRAVVLAIALPDNSRVVACNVSITMSQAQRIRIMLPQLLDGLMVDNDVMDGSALDTLPDPLPFPHYNPHKGYAPNDRP